MSEAKCEVCPICGKEKADRHYNPCPNDRCYAWLGDVLPDWKMSPEQELDHWRRGYTRLADYIREGKHLIAVRMEGFPCADLDDCENLEALLAIGTALDGKES